MYAAEPLALKASAFSNSSQPEHLTGSNIYIVHFLLTHFLHSFHKSDLHVIWCAHFAQALTLALQNGTNLLPQARWKL